MHGRSLLSDEKSYPVYELKKRDSSWLRYQTFMKDVEQATERVYTEEAAFLGFESPGAKSLSSAAFDGCTGLGIESKKGGIIAHASQNEPGTKNAISLVTDIVNKNRAAIKDATVVIYAEVCYDNHNKFAYEPQVEAFQKFVQQLLGITARIETYYSPANDKNPKYEQYPIYGAMLMKNAGGGSARSQTEVVNVSWQSTVKRAVARS